MLLVSNINPSFGFSTWWNVHEHCKYLKLVLLGPRCNPLTSFLSSQRSRFSMASTLHDNFPLCFYCYKVTDGQCLKVLIPWVYMSQTDLFGSRSLLLSSFFKTKEAGLLRSHWLQDHWWSLPEGYGILSPIWTSGPSLKTLVKLLHDNQRSRFTSVLFFSFSPYYRIT